MEKTVEKLEGMFEKAELDINNLTQRLKYDFENNEDLEVNPVRLLDKLSDVKKEYKSIVQETEAIQQAEKEAVEELKSHLSNIFLMVQKLQTEGVDMGGEKPEELKHLEQLTGLSVPWGDGSEPVVAEPVASSTAVLSRNSGVSDDQNNAVTSDTVDDAQISMTTNRDSSTEFQEITKAEFESVSSLVRGRVKLTEVNCTFKTLWEHYKTSKDSRPYSAEDMRTMGLRVSGATGQAKLNVLRALKIVKISPKGDVTMLIKKQDALLEKWL